MRIQASTTEPEAETEPVPVPETEPETETETETDTHAHAHVPRDFPHALLGQVGEAGEWGFKSVEPS